MASLEDHHKIRTWLCSVVFLDIVSYSKQSVEVQMEWKERFNRYLAVGIQELAENDRVILDTGDGAAICFLGDPEAAMFCAMKLRSFMVEEEAARGGVGGGMRCRIGINLGSVKLIKDINGNLNAVGDGINVAQRVMSFAGDNQILVSRSFYEVVSCLSDSYSQLFKYGGVRKDKHVREHTVYDLLAPGSEGAAPQQQACAIDDVPVKACALALDPVTLGRIERFLAPILGPMAHHLIKTHSARATTPMDLHRALTAFIPAKADQEAFLRFCVAEFSGPGGTAAAATTGTSLGAPVAAARVQAATPAPEAAAPARPPFAVDPALGERLRKELAAYVGPMAKMILSRASGKAKSLGELYDLLAAEISAPKDREKFRRAVAMIKNA
jgi:class 3 adenylate cyclase